MIFACRQLFPRKGIRFLVEAVAQLKPRFPELQLVLAGDGFERPTLVHLAEELGIVGDVHFLGWVPNSALPPYYRAAALSVVPSLEEGFGIPAAEAMGCEVPVVASDAGGLPEVVEHGVTGLIVPRGDTDALAQAIGSLLEDPERRRRMGVAGRERALRLFDWDRTAEQFEAALPRGRRQGEPVSQRQFVFRWDVDHRVCVTDGIPRIRAVCRDFGVPNTFFVNMGRSTNLREWLGKGMVRSKAKLADKDAVHLIQKTGWPRFLLETALARPVGLNFVPVLQELQHEGHELGLHGGMDHVIWSRRFHELPDAVLQADVDESYGHFVRNFGRPDGLHLSGVLFRRPGDADDRPMGFTYDGDAIGGEPRRATADGDTLRHWTIPVTLCGPGTVPFLEYHGARQTPESQMLEELDQHLEGRSLVVLYGHPCYEGVREQVLRKVFARVLEHGFHFVTMQALAARLETARPGSMIRVLSVFGTRPEAIKMAPVIRRLEARPDRFESVICVSAQHRDMLDQVLDVFALRPQHDLEIMTPGQSPAGVAARVLDRLPPLLREIRPDVLLVQGDTMTTFAASFAAYLERIPSCHVEAGLRTGNRYHPFPEEMNRVLTTRLADLHFAPTDHRARPPPGRGRPRGRPFSSPATR